MQSVRSYVLARLKKGGNFTRDLYKNCYMEAERCILGWLRRILDSGYALHSIWTRAINERDGVSACTFLMNKAIEGGIAESYINLDKEHKAVFLVAMDKYLFSSRCNCSIDCSCDYFVALVLETLEKECIIRKFQ